MTNNDKMMIIIEYLEKHLDIPTYLEEYVKKDILDALNQIEKLEK